MAIKCTHQTVSGIALVEAYIRVENVTIYKSLMTFRVAVHADATKPSIDVTGHAAPYDFDGANPFAQAYGYLKTLSEFVEAVDC